MRARTSTILLGALLGLLLAIAPVAAQEDDHAEDTGPAATVPAGSVDIGDGFSFTGGVITSPGEEPRPIDAMHAAVFVQSWLAASIFGEVNLQDPPPDLPVHRLDIDGSWAFTPGTLTVYYATDDTTAWVSLPGDQTPTATPPETPPAPSGWFVADPRVIGAFNGTEELEGTAGVQAATTTSRPPSDDSEEQAASEDSSDEDPPWALIGLGAAVVVGGGLVLAWTRRGRSQPE